MAKTLRTKDSPWTKVFRRIVQQAKNDPDFKRVVGDGFRSWDGSASEKAPPQPKGTQPVVFFTPNPSAVSWYSPDLQMGTLAVKVDLFVETKTCDDIIDLWDLIVQALQPGGPALSIPAGSGNCFGQDLVLLGAETGEPVFTLPAFDPEPANQPEGVYAGAGRFELRVGRSVF